MKYNVPFEIMVIINYRLLMLSWTIDCHRCIIIIDTIKLCMRHFDPHEYLSNIYLGLSGRLTDNIQSDGRSRPILYQHSDRHPTHIGTM